MSGPIRCGALGLGLFAIVACPREAFASRGCREVSDVVGYEHCTRYGFGWAEEHSAPILLELSLGPTFLDTKNRTMSGSFGKNQKGSFEYPGSRVGHGVSDRSLGLRIGAPFVPWAYAGFELGFGGGSNKLPATTTSEYSVSASTSGINGFAFHGGAYGGLRAPLGYLSIRVETLFGGHMIGTSQIARDAKGSSRSATVNVATWVIEPRVYADVWVAPWMTLSVFGGINAVHFADKTAGLSIGFHGRNYDGAFLW